MRIGVFGLSCLGAMLLITTPASADTDVRMSPFSGKPVPRFESLRYSAANGRTGPSTQHPIQWTYERVGLPMLIVKESTEWRRVRDPAGAEVWMHARMLTDTATGMAREDTTLLTEPSEHGTPVARIHSGAILSIKRRADGWLNVRAGGMKGWVRSDEVWGGAAQTGQRPIE